MTLRALVIGAGWAGEGHTLGLRDAGVEVVAMCGRTPEPARARAQQLNIPELRFDWRAAIAEFQPDIVAIGTPGDTHRAIAEAAVEAGCHVVCEKPLATSAADARAMLEVVERAGVKHAYAATGRYAPATIHAEALVAQGTVGLLREVNIISYDMFPPDLPYSWAFDNARGGGMLANSFPHALGRLLRITGGKVVACTGAATVVKQRLAVAPMLHDFRQLFGTIEGWDPAQATEWREAEADLAYTVVLDLRMPQGHIARAVLSESLLVPGAEPSEVKIFGDDGALALGNGHHDVEVRRFNAERQAWDVVPPMEGLMEGLPQVEDAVQRAWNQFFREFVADVRGDGSAGYLTFHDGYVAMEAIEAALGRRSWMAP
jgi:predicted dehydrogenase